MNFCDTWRWLALEGELCSVSGFQATFTRNGVLLTVIGDVVVTTGMQIIPHRHVAITQSLAPLIFVLTADANTGELVLRWNPFFRRVYGNLLRP